MCEVAGEQLYTQVAVLWKKKKWFQLYRSPTSHIPHVRAHTPRFRAHNRSWVHSDTSSKHNGWSEHSGRSDHLWFQVKALKDIVCYFGNFFWVSAVAHRSCLPISQRQIYHNCRSHWLPCKHVVYEGHAWLAKERQNQYPKALRNVNRIFYKLRAGPEDDIKTSLLHLGIGSTAENHFISLCYFYQTCQLDKAGNSAHLQDTEP